MPKSRKIIEYIYDIQEKIDTIKIRMEKVSYNKFYKDKILMESIIWNITVIGEALSHVEMELLLKYNKNKKYWLDIRGARNFMIHEYHGIEEFTVYKIATRSIVELEKYILKMLDDLEK